MSPLQILRKLKAQRAERDFITAHERQFDPSRAHELWAFAADTPDEWPDPSDDTPSDERGECAA